MFAERKTHDVCAAEKTLSFDKYKPNKQFANNCDNSKYALPAVPHAFNFLLKFFNSLVDVKFFQITCSAVLSLATDFLFWRKIVKTSDKISKQKTLQTLFIKFTLL